MFNDIFKYRSHLAQNKSGVEEVMINGKKSYHYLNCFENSIWYYPGQKCDNINLSFNQSDIKLNLEYYDLDRKLSRFNNNNRVNDRITHQYDRNFLEIYNQIYLRKEKTSISFTLLDLLKQVDKYRDDYRIILLSACRPINYESSKSNHFQYEAFIHFINSKLYKQTVEGRSDKTDMRKKCNVLCWTEYKNVKYILDDRINSYYNKNPNFSRKTPNYIRIYNQIYTFVNKNQEKINQYTSLNQVPYEEIIKLEDLRFLALGKPEEIFLFFIKIYYEALEEIPDKQKNLVFERLIIYFLVKNREEIEYIFYYLNNGMFRIMEIYLENEDKFFIENIEHYINLHAFFICILKNLIYTKMLL